MTSVQDRCNVAAQRMMTRRRIDAIIGRVEALEYNRIGVYISRLQRGDDLVIGCMYRQDLARAASSRVVTCEIKVQGQDLDLVVFANNREQFVLDSDDMKAAAQVTALLLSRLTDVY